MFRGAEVGGFNPWDWCPSRQGWFKLLRQSAARWSPDPTLALEADRIREFLITAIDASEDWLYHPCLIAVFDARRNRLRKEIQLTLWAAGHSDTCLGSITIPKTVQCWTPAGSQTITRGIHRLSDICHPHAPVRLCIDPYSLSLGEAVNESWGALPSISDEDLRCIKDQIRSFLSAVSNLESSHPACSRWVSAAARVAIPLTNTGVDRTRSWSSRTTPGAVHLDVSAGELLILEALVHESAHCHLYMEEAHGPLVETTDTEVYTSPLRPDPRPLRGILLAYHALAYICAFYGDAIARGIGDCSFAANELRLSRDKMKQAEQIIVERETSLTALGRAFVEKTGMVAQYGVSLSQSTA